jgi:hypothetical protein
MKPVEFPGVNVVFAKDQSEYMPLPAMKIPNDPQGLNQMAVIPGRIGESKRNRNNTFVNADV